MYDYEWQKEWKDYYEILGVSNDASAEEIKKSYRKLSKENHPDAHNNEEKYQSIFKLLNEAYEILGNKEKRRIYDQEYIRRQQGEPENEEDFSFEEPDINYEDAAKEHLEALKRSLEREACRKIIKDELEKSIEYLQARNEVLASVYDLHCEKEAYFQNIEELQQLAYAYLNELQELAESAKDYDLIDLKEEIEERIVFLLDKFEILSAQKIPVDKIIVSVKNVFKNRKHYGYVNVEDEQFLSQQITAEYLDKKNEADNLLEELKSFYYSCSNKVEIPLHYEKKLNAILLKLSELVDYFGKLQNISKTLFNRNFFEGISDVIKKLNFRLGFVPDSYRKAGLYGEALHFQDELHEFLTELEQNKNLFFQIQQLILNCSAPLHSCSYDYLSSVAQSMYNDFHEKDVKIRNDYARLLRLSGAEEIEKIRIEKEKIFLQDNIFDACFVPTNDTLHLSSYNALRIYELKEKEHQLMEFSKILKRFNQFTTSIEKLDFWEDFYATSLKKLKKKWGEAPPKNSFHTSSSTFSSCFNNPGKKKEEKTSKSRSFSSRLSSYVMDEILDEIDIKKRNLFFINRILKFFLGAEVGICVYHGIRIFQNPSDFSVRKIYLALGLSAMFTTAYWKSLSSQYYANLNKEEIGLSMLLKLR